MDIIRCFLGCFFLGGGGASHAKNGFIEKVLFRDPHCRNLFLAVYSAFVERKWFLTIIFFLVSNLQTRTLLSLINIFLLRSRRNAQRP